MLFNVCSIDYWAARGEEFSHFIDSTICWSYVLHVVYEARWLLYCACVVITMVFSQTKFPCINIL